MVEMEILGLWGGASRRSLLWFAGGRIEQTGSLFVHKHVGSAFWMQGPEEVQEGEGRWKDTGLRGWTCSDTAWPVLAMSLWVTGCELSRLSVPL